MFKSVTILFLLLSCFTSFSQTDTAQKKSVKGFVFISAYNGTYDYDGGHMRPVGFHDYFFPTNKIDVGNFWIAINT